MVDVTLATFHQFDKERWLPWLLGLAWLQVGVRRMLPPLGAMPRMLICVA